MTPEGARTLGKMYETQIGELRADIAALRKYGRDMALTDQTIAKKAQQIFELEKRLKELEPDIRKAEADRRQEEDDREWLEEQQRLF